MEPTYHLEGVVRSREEMEDFEGPLNLILQLLSKNKIEIRDIRISDILDQYLAQLSEMQEMDLEVASEFVQMASYLLYIKTKTLLTGEEEVSELEQLMTSLEQLRFRDSYAAIRAVVPELQRAAERGLLLFSCPGEPQPRYGAYDYRHTGGELLAALLQLRSRAAAAGVPEPQLRPLVPRPIVYGVRDKSRQLLDRLRSRGAMRLEDLYALCGSRSELVATFLSVLELCSLGSLRLSAGEGDSLLVSFAGGDTEAILNEISE